MMAGLVWALSGVFGQFLYEHHPKIDSNWMIPVRLLLSSVILLTYNLLRNKEELTKIVSVKRDLLVAILTGIGGTMMFQLSFYKSIQYSNAGTATILQYLCPTITIFYVCIRSRRNPKPAEILASTCALLGIFLISTHGNPSELVINSKALIWGIGSAFFMMTSAVIPEKLYTRYNTITVMAIAMPAGGLVLSALLRPWEYEIHYDLILFVSMFVIVVSGSVLGYFFYGASVHLVGPDKTTLLACTEPLVAALLSAFWLKTRFELMDLVGFALIIATLIIPAITLNKHNKK